MSEAWLEGVLISASPIGGLTGNRETPVRAPVPVGAIAPAMRNVAPGQPGAKAPGQRPSRPKAGASHPPGRALAFVSLVDMVLREHGRTPGGETRCVSCPARPDDRPLPDQQDFPARQGAGMS